MEEVVDWTHATNSPEELAIHFLLRHAECRMALIEQAGDEPLPNHAPSRFPPDAPVVLQAVANSRQADELRSRGNAAAARVTENDSCAALFSRAYAAARHKPASGHTSWLAQKTA